MGRRADAARHHRQRRRSCGHRDSDADRSVPGTLAPKLPPLGWFIQLEEVAAAVAYFLSPEAAAMTGQQLVICGGSSL
ncbi:SDR family oxidoreductase [Methylobacterium variabile]|uniref:SDR family oxidoreductase n=1 Tax=Methylobacterium variabile TaxID=298794 RepID=UPI0024751D29|nr:SDR family oxidoreductase [Methylobacterium variabile]